MTCGSEGELRSMMKGSSPYKAGWGVIYTNLRNVPFFSMIFICRHSAAAAAAAPARLA
jgi:hypothetical protein